MYRFLSEEWFEAARSHLEPVSISPECSCRVQFDASGVMWALVVERGRVTQWRLGRLDRADLELRWSRDDAERILRRELRGNDALLATTVAAEAADGTYIGPPAPLNLMPRSELATLPVAAGASFTVQYVYRHGPFGDVDYVQRFDDGRLVEERLGVASNPDIVAHVSYLAMARIRADEISIIEALESGTVTGEIGPLAALAGILESPEFHDAEIATGSQMITLSVLGELDADPTFAAAMQQLAETSSTS